MVTKRTSPASLKKKIRILSARQRELRLHVLRMRENLLLSDKQILQSIIYFFTVIYHDFKSVVVKLVPPAPLSIRKLSLKEQLAALERELAILDREKARLTALSRSPLILLVWTLKGINGVVSLIPRTVSYIRVKRELGNKPLGKQKRDILFFTSHPFHGSRCRARFLADAMGKRGERVFYIEGSFDVAEGRKARFSIQKEQYVYTAKLSSGRNIEIQLQPASGRDVQKIATSFRHFLKEAKITDYTAIIEHPFWAYLLPHLKGKVVYDCNRDFIDKERYAEHIHKLHRELLKKSDTVVSSSKLLARHLRKIAKKTIKHIPNGCDYEHFARASVKKDTCSAGLCWIHKPVIGYIGDCDERIDASLVEKVALAYPKASIVMIGKIDNPALLNVGERLPNVFLLGEKPYEKLPEYLQTFDTCFIPYDSDGTNKYLNPIILYEFLAAGKSITARWRDSVNNKLWHGAKSENHFVEYIQLSLKLNTMSIKKKRIQYSKRNIWLNKAAMLCQG